METLKIKKADLNCDLGISQPEFPKYWTGNMANQYSQGTRAKHVGQMSDLIQEFNGNSYSEWVAWYTAKMPDAIDIATDRTHLKLIEMGITWIPHHSVKIWVEDLVLAKTYVGLKVQASILTRLATLYDTSWRLARPEEESLGIDGYVGKTPISVKPMSYKQNALNEIIDVALVYYEKNSNGITVEYDPMD